MSRASRDGASPGKLLVALAKRQAELAIDLRVALADAGGRPWADALVARARSLASEVEEAGVDVQLGRRELGPPGPGLPILAAIERAGSGRDAAAERSRAVREDLAISASPVAPAPPAPIPWRHSPVDALGSEFADGLFDSEIETLGEAWDVLESGALVDVHEWSVADAKALEAALVKLRHEAGDPAPFTAPIAEEPPKPKKRRKSDRSFDLITKGGEWVARIWAEDSGTAWGLANTAFPAFYEKPSDFDINPASAKYAQDVVNCGGKRLRDVAYQNYDGTGGRERFSMASADPVGIPTGAPQAPGKTLAEQGYEPGAGPAAPGKADPVPPDDWEDPKGEVAAHLARMEAGTAQAEVYAYEVYLPDEGEGKPRSFLGLINAPTLAEAIDRAPGEFAGDIEPGTRLELSPAKGMIEGKYAEIAECVGCGKRWPRWDAVGCPDCVHGPTPEMPKASPDRLFALDAFIQEDGGEPWVVGHFTASDPLTPPIPESIVSCVVHPEKLRVRPALARGERAWACNGCNEVVLGHAPAAGGTCSRCKRGEFRPVVIGDHGEILPDRDRGPFRYEVFEYAPFRQSKDIASFTARGADEAKARVDREWPGMNFRLAESQPALARPEPAIAPSGESTPVPATPAKPARKPPTKTFRLVYRGDDADQTIDCGEFKARDFDEARARVPELCRHESVRLADGRVVAMNLARVEVVQVPATPRKKKEVVCG